MNNIQNVSVTLVTSATHTVGNDNIFTMIYLWLQYGIALPNFDSGSKSYTETFGNFGNRLPDSNRM